MNSSEALETKEIPCSMTKSLFYQLLNCFKTLPKHSSEVPKQYNKRADPHSKMSLTCLLAFLLRPFNCIQNYFQQMCVSYTTQYACGVVKTTIFTCWHIAEGSLNFKTCPRYTEQYNNLKRRNCDTCRAKGWRGWLRSKWGMTWMRNCKV